MTLLAPPDRARPGIPLAGGRGSMTPLECSLGRPGDVFAPAHPWREAAGR